MHNIQDERGVLCPAPDPGRLRLGRLLPLEEPGGPGGWLLDLQVFQGAGSDTAHLGCQGLVERAHATAGVCKAMGEGSRREHCSSQHCLPWWAAAPQTQNLINAAATRVWDTLTTQFPNINTIVSCGIYLPFSSQAGKVLKLRQGLENENHRCLQLFALITSSNATPEKSHIPPFLAQVCVALAGPVLTATPRDTGEHSELIPDGSPCILEQNLFLVSHM